MDFQSIVFSLKLYAVNRQLSHWLSSITSGLFLSYEIPGLDTIFDTGAAGLTFSVCIVNMQLIIHKSLLEQLTVGPQVASIRSLDY